MARRRKEVQPDPARLIQALRSIGYKFESAVADLIDNSISAKAEYVEICIAHDDDGLKYVEIYDDGHGMEDRELDIAMRFGAPERDSENSLGKYGLGLKLAALSQCQELTLVSRRKGKPLVGRGWTVQGIESGWQLETLHSSECEEFTEERNALRPRGTAVFWTGFDRIAAGDEGIDRLVNRLVGRLKRHLGLMFHRFLSSGRKCVAMQISVWHVETDPDDAEKIDVTPLDPFGYDEPGHEDAPFRMHIKLPDGVLYADCHIWPPKNEIPSELMPNYTLPGGAAKAQGIYIYRNQRLIQAGGWNHVIDADAEPHKSLARVAIDLPPKFDNLFGLDLKKSSLKPPPSFIDGMKSAKSSNGVTFQQYLKLADIVYRKKDPKALRSRTPIPDAGFNKRSLSHVQKALRIPGKAGGRASEQKIEITWETFDGDPQVFRIDLDGGRLELNSFFRKKLLDGRSNKSGDTPALKALLFLLVEQDFTAQRLSTKRKEAHRRINKALLAAIGVKL